MKRFSLWGLISIAAHAAVYLAISGNDQGTGLQKRTLEVGLVQIAPPAVANEKHRNPSPAASEPPTIGSLATEPAASPAPPTPTENRPDPANRVPRKAPAAHSKTTIPQDKVIFEEKRLLPPGSHRAQESAAIASTGRTEDNTPKTAHLTTDLHPASSDSPPTHPKALQVATAQKVAPRYLRTPPPTYPLRARQRGWEGEVWLRVQVGTDGRVVDLWIEQSSGHSLLDQSAIKTIRNWLFHPAKINSKPAVEEVRLPVRFSLTQS